MHTKKLTLFLLITIPLAPLLLAWMMLYQKNALTLNHHGDLIAPPQLIQAPPFHASGNRWILHIGSKPYDLDSLHRALGKNQRRVQQFEAPLAPFDQSLSTGIYLIDPQGYLMMHYSEETAPRDILIDFKRLLRVNHA